MEDKFEYVDLGLTSGTLWANQNLPGYYAFGEFKEKESYTLDNSITFYKDKKKLISEGLCDYKGNIISNHSFSIPTKEQFLELMSECTWKWDNNLLGYTITSNKNTNSIFLGTDGYKLKTDIVDKGIWGNYWTSTIIDGQFYACYLYFFKNAIYYENHSERFYGRSIRPVLNTNTDNNGTTTEDGSDASITIDPTPTQNSNNAVSSGGVYNAIITVDNKIGQPVSFTFTYDDDTTQTYNLLTSNS